MGYQHAEKLHRGIRDGTIGFLENEWEEFISEHDSDTMQLIAEGLSPNPNRSAELDGFIEASDEAYLSDAWPQLKVLGCWLGVRLGSSKAALALLQACHPSRRGLSSQRGRDECPNRR